MLRNTLVLLFSSVIWFSVANGQDEDAQLEERVYSREYFSDNDSTIQSRKPGKITVFQDQRITDLDNLKKENPGLQDGYRVQIFFGKRQEALEEKANFAETYPDLPAYISYLAPNFRLRVGDFRSRMEGEKLKREINSEYPGSYLVKDKIELPSLEKTELPEEEEEFDETTD